MSTEFDPQSGGEGTQAALATFGVTAPKVLDRLLEVLSLKKDVELATLLNVSKATVSTWRSRNKIPYDAIVLLYLKSRIDLVYCLTGEKVGAVEGYPAYHAGLELAAVMTDMRQRYGPPENWKLEAGVPKKGTDDGAQ